MRGPAWRRPSLTPVRVIHLWFGNLTGWGVPKHLIETVNHLHAQGSGFASVRESIDTTTSGGKLIFHVFGALAEFERELIRERTQAGLKAARARGKKGGRPRCLTPPQVAMAQKLMADPDVSIASICQTLNISRPTLYRYCPSPFTKKAQGKAQVSLGHEARI